MKLRYLFFLLCSALTLCGCSMFSSSPDNAAQITIGSSLEIDNTDSSRTLLDNMDALATDGLYYAAWGIGENEPYENSDGKTVKLYDAQIYLLLEECKSSAAAQHSMDSWLDTGRTNYDVSEETEAAYNGQTYTKLTYRFKGEDSPYAHGISVFLVSGSSAVCVELTCRDRFADDPETVLTDFLNSCTYLTEQTVLYESDEE